MREVFLGLAATFVLLFGGLTVYVIVANGVTVPSLFAVVILAMVGIGIHGAIRNPPDE